MKAVVTKGLSWVLGLAMLLSGILFLSLPVQAASPSESSYDGARNYVIKMMKYEEDASLSSIWAAMDLVREGTGVPQTYKDSVARLIQEKKGILHTGNGDYTNYAKTVLFLTACGIDPTDICGYDLIEKLSDVETVSKQGINGVIYALIALDSHNYKTDYENAREDYIQSILNAQLNDGGWAYGAKSKDDKADPDMTAMALQALAPYMNRENVSQAIDRAIERLSALQQSDGGFLTEDADYEESSESSSMVLLALNALGIDARHDSRFLKGGKSVIDNISLFAVEGGLAHVKGGSANAIASEQGFRALSSNLRVLDGEPYIYDMNDVILEKYEAPLPVLDGWIQDEATGAWYYFINDEMQYGWQLIKGAWYFLNPQNGRMATGWLLENGAWYYLYSSGAMATGWLQDNGKWYYLYPSGAMAANEWIGGYWLNGDGSWTYKPVGSWKRNSKGWWYGDTSGWYASAGGHKIDGVVYFFDDSGYFIH